MPDSMGEGETGVLRFDFDGRLKLEFHGTKVTLDAGILAFRELDDALGPTKVEEEHLIDPGTGKNRQHGTTGQFRLSAFARLGGCAAENGADRLGHDPATLGIVGGHAVKPAASASQMGRFETEFLAIGDTVATLSNTSGHSIDQVYDRHPPYFERHL